MNNVVQLPLAPLEEIISCAFEVGTDGTTILSAGIAFTHPNPNKRIVDAIMKHKQKIIGNFYHQFKVEGRHKYAIAAVLTLDEKNIPTFTEHKDITEYAEFDV